jgi:hypothetical protein
MPRARNSGASLMSDFDWEEARQDPATFIPEQPATAIFTNPNGDLVIRQQGDYREEDQFVVIARTNVERLLVAISETMGLEPLAAPAPLLPKPSPLTSVERSRRYRDRHAQRDAVVTERDADGRGENVTLFEQAAE